MIDFWRPLFLCVPVLQTSKKGQQSSVPQKKCKQRVECSSKKRFLIVYDHFDSYTMKSSPTSTLNIKDNTGIMSNLSNHSNHSDGNHGDSNHSDKSTVAVTGNGFNPSDDNDNVSVTTDNSSLPTISVTEPESPILPTLPVAENKRREVTDVLGESCSSDFSDLETLTQAGRRDLAPGTRTDVSPLMKMELSKQRASLRRSSPFSKSSSSKRICQSREQPQPGGCAIGSIIYN